MPKEKVIYETVKDLAKALLNKKMQVGIPLLIKSTGLIFIGAPQTNKENEKDADLMDATNIETGEVGEIIVPMIVKQKLLRNYVDGGYVNKSFSIVKREKLKPTDRWYPYEVTEIKVK